VAHNHGAELSPIELHIQNDIPLGKGMGSSAAALTTGVIIADQLLAWDGSPCAFWMKPRAWKATRITWRPARWARLWPAPSIPAA